MTYDELIERLDPTIYRNLKQAIELGKWPDGRAISREQRAICLEAVIYYENKHNVPEQERVGYLDRGEKAGTACDPSVQFRKDRQEQNNEVDPDQFVEVKV
ncbi:YeaC family protein [Marinobacter sp. SBS5]|uniref:YeaC family protein n=1 Tax=Marinobacter sp. SBS5 TaxID=3401754 RepID=UPI003AAF64A1